MLRLLLLVKLKVGRRVAGCGRDLRSQHGRANEGGRGRRFRARDARSAGEQAQPGRCPSMSVLEWPFMMTQATRRANSLSRSRASCQRPPSPAQVTTQQLPRAPGQGQTCPQPLGPAPQTLRLRLLLRRAAAPSRPCRPCGSGCPRESRPAAPPPPAPPAPRPQQRRTARRAGRPPGPPLPPPPLPRPPRYRPISLLRSPAQTPVRRITGTG